MVDHTVLEIQGLLSNLWINPGLAQIGAPGIYRPEDAALVFSGPRFFIALVAGLVLAFGFQILLTNFSVAAGISYLGHRSDHPDTSHSHESLGGTAKKVGTALGVWTLITVTIALFVACLLAVKLSLINSPLLGAIVGLVIWATYFSMMVWISSTTVGSLIGSVVNAATSGFQTILGTATNALGAKMARDQIVTTAEAAAAAIRREVTSGLDAESMREQFEDYLNRLRPSEVDVKGLQQDFEQFLKDQDLQAIADPNQLRKIDHQVFVDLVSSRTDLSKRDASRIADQLEASWRKTVDQITATANSNQDLVTAIRSGKPGQMLSEQIDRFVQQNRKQEQSPGLISQFLNGLMGVAIGRADLKDFDVEKILNQLKSTRDHLTTQADKVTHQIQGKPSTPYSPIRADIENYLLNTYSWQMTPARVEHEFREVLYDPEANPIAVRRELEQLTRTDFINLLKSRGVFTQDQMTQLSFQLEAVRRSVLRELVTLEDHEKEQALLTQLDSYLRLAPRETLLNQDLLVNDLRPILADPEVSAERVRDRFSKFNQSRLLMLLEPRTDLSYEEKQQVVMIIERVFGLVAADAHNLQQATQARVSAQWQKVEDHLRNTKKSELDPDRIKQDINTLLHDPQTGIHDLRVRASHFDRDTLVKLLSQRPDLSEAEANQILDQVEDNWHRVSHAPQQLMATATGQYDQATHAIADYLRNTGRPELDPKGIKHDLQMLLSNPKLGGQALRDRLASLDRETLVQLLSQRQDLTEEQVNQMIDQVLSSVREVLRSPRRLALRTQNQVRDFQTTLADYLRNTHKSELDPEDIQRDLQILLHDPRLGMELMGDRLSQIDRSTLIALLSQRPDLSETEANQIVDRILNVRDQIQEQTRAIQLHIQAALDHLLAKIRAYLNGLERPELNYEGIRQDLRTLFDDPQAGFDALRDRLSQFDRDTLIALLSSREDISKADAERLIAQVERTRNSVLNRAERIQHQVQDRLDEIKYQAQRQVEESRKAAATASWWLFATALCSAAFSAIAGGLAVAG